MSKGRRNRRLRAGETARQDQMATGAREESRRDPAALVILIEYADPGLTCSWCDCTDLHATSTECPRPCARDAQYVLRTLIGGVDRRPRIPFCADHSDDVARVHRRLVGGMPMDFRLVSILDEDQGDPHGGAR